MKAENWIVIAGITFLVFLLITVIVPDQFADKDTASSHLNNNQNVAAGGVQGSTSANAPQHTGTVGGMVPFSRAKVSRFQGTIVQVDSLGSNTGWGQVHIWVDDGSGNPPTEISVAPDWYLMHMDCMVKADFPISGKVFNFAKTHVALQLYAKNLKIGRKTCNLRNDEGFALWSNRLR